MGIFHCYVCLPEGICLSIYSNKGSVDCSISAPTAPELANVEVKYTLTELVAEATNVEHMEEDTKWAGRRGVEGFTVKKSRLWLLINGKGEQPKI